MPCFGQLQSLEFLTERRNRTGMFNFTTPITSLGIIVPQFPFGAKTQSSPPEPESTEPLEPRYGLALGLQLQHHLEPQLRPDGQVRACLGAPFCHLAGP